MDTALTVLLVALLAALPVIQLVAMQTPNDDDAIRDGLGFVPALVRTDDGEVTSGALVREETDVEFISEVSADPDLLIEAVPLRELLRRWEVRRSRRSGDAGFRYVDEEGWSHVLRIRPAQAAGLRLLLDDENPSYDAEASHRLNRVRSGSVMFWAACGVVAFSVGFMNLFTVAGNSLFALGVAWPLLAIVFTRHRRPEPGESTIRVWPADPGPRPTDQGPSGTKHPEAAEDSRHRG